MRIQKIYILLTIVVPFTVASQWQEHLINDNASSANKLVVIDFDNDGHQDIVVNQRSQNGVYWYKNDGTGNFSEPLLIAGNLQNLRGLAVGDLTGNGFNDVVITIQTSQAHLNNLFWIEHLDGQGTFAFRRVIQENSTTISNGVVIGDIDGDGWLDIIVSASAASDRTITWYKNQGDGTFSSPNVVTSGFSNAIGIAVGDINGNGFLDIVSGTSNTGVTSWFENLDGEGNFGPPIPIGTPGMYNILRMHLVDIDGDGDLDLVGSGSSIFAWWENLDGQGNFSAERFVETDFFITANYPVDIDGDGDIDLFALSPVSPPDSLGFMFWYENLDGIGNYSEPHLITSTLVNAVTIEAADLNGNGFSDPVSASQTNGTIVWYENPLLSVNENESNDFVLYPNPVNDSLYIQTSRVPLEYLIYNSKGQKIMEGMWQPSQTYIDVSHLSSGIYFGELNYPNSKEKFKFLKQ